MATKQKSRIEFGDFQTPLGLARKVCSLIHKISFEPASIIEPTCGRGAFIQAVMEAFPNAKQVLGFDLNPIYVNEAKRITRSHSRAVICQSDFFQTDWESITESLTEPILVIGNPPWVTNATLGFLGSDNLPQKTNVDNLRGIYALTGKSNFDISECMLRTSIRWLSHRNGMLAVLCKTAVARKILMFAWTQGVPIRSTSIYRIDANAHFGASVDACLLVIRTSHDFTTYECADYESLDAIEPKSVFGLREGELVADVILYERRKDLRQSGLKGWRSGIKHDCSKVFELKCNNGQFINRLGEIVDLEPQVVFPLLKSSDIASHRDNRKWLLVPQSSMSDSPERLKIMAPKAWKYLLDHTEYLDRRSSLIYRNRPRFSIFGIGPYSFAPWKIAISGLYKKLEFTIVGPVGEKPVLFDDTCYFFPCNSKEESMLLYKLVTSEPAREFWAARIFWDAKRPITADLLNSLDLALLAREIGIDSEIAQILSDRQITEYTFGAHQLSLFR